MTPIWKISDSDIKRWRKFLASIPMNDFIQARQDRNIDRKNIVLTESSIWKTFVECQVTTQQRSGPNTPVNLFLNSNSPALNYDQCLEVGNLEQMLKNELTNARLRRINVITSNLMTILEELNEGEWDCLLCCMKKLASEKKPPETLERNVVMYMQKFPGLGPKQSRNFLQSLGLSQNEIPIDSRILNKLKEFGCSFVPRSTALSDETVYRFVQKGLQQIANKIDVPPCLLDAYIFSSYDHKK